MVVEERDLDAGSQGARKLAELCRVAQLDEHEPRDPRRIDPGRVDEVELVRMQPRELPHVAVQRARQDDNRVGIEPAARQHRRERVEVGVRMTGDDLHALEMVRAAARPSLASAR